MKTSAPPFAWRLSPRRRAPKLATPCASSQRCTTELTSNFGGSINLCYLFTIGTNENCVECCFAPRSQISSRDNRKKLLVTLAEHVLVLLPHHSVLVRYVLQAKWSIGRANSTQGDCRENLVKAPTSDALVLMTAQPINSSLCLVSAEHWCCLLVKRRANLRQSSLSALRSGARKGPKGSTRAPESCHIPFVASIVCTTPPFVQNGLHSSSSSL
jgi:hypothetical protein